jgi:hypothetical protein
MSKNPNSRPKQTKRDEPMSGAMKFFLAGCVAELYLLILRRFYVNGTLEQVVAWDRYLNYFLYGGLAILAVGLLLVLVWRKQAKTRWATAWWISGAGAFLTVASGLIRVYYSSALTLLCIVVPVVMLLGILWSLYDRECAWALSILGFSLIALWVCRRGMGSQYLGTTVKIGAGVCLVLLAAIAFLARQADQNGGMLGKLRVLPADADVLPVYVACGLSFLALASAFVSVTVAYYAMWALAIVVFALAVYYTVKQL